MELRDGGVGVEVSGSKLGCVCRDRVVRSSGCAGRRARQREGAGRTGVARGREGGKEVVAVAAISSRAAATRWSSNSGSSVRQVQW